MFIFLLKNKAPIYTLVLIQWLAIVQKIDFLKNLTITNINERHILPPMIFESLPEGYYVYLYMPVKRAWKEHL